MDEHYSSQDHGYVLRRLEGVSFKPILSVGNYLSLDIECIVAGSSDRTIRFLDTETLDEVAKATMEKKNVSFVAISGMSPDGDDPVIITGGKDSIIQVWDPTAGSVDKSISLPTTEVRSLAVYQGSQILVIVGTKDGQVLVWDVVENTQVANFKGHQASVHCVCVALTKADLEDTDDDMDFLCIASGGADRTVRTWNIRTGKKVKKFRHTRSISSIIVTNRGIRPLLATAGVERVIKLWDLNSGILLRSLEGHLDQINTLALWEGYQMLLISGSGDHTIRVYDMLSGECICVLTGHRDAVLSLTIANLDDPKIVSSSEDLSLIQWDLNQIIYDFYDMEGEYVGARNDRPAYVPPIAYSAPEELDKSSLSREERKRIRKERKRAKRIKNLYHDWSSKSGQVSSRGGEDDEDWDPEMEMGEDFNDTQEFTPPPTTNATTEEMTTKLSEEKIPPVVDEPGPPSEDEDIDGWFQEEGHAEETTEKADEEVSKPTEIEEEQPKEHRERASTVIGLAITNAIHKVIPAKTKDEIEAENKHVITRRASKSVIRGVLENVLGVKSSTVAIEVTPEITEEPAQSATTEPVYSPVPESSSPSNAEAIVPIIEPVQPEPRPSTEEEAPVTATVEPASKPSKDSTTRASMADNVDFRALADETKIRHQKAAEQHKIETDMLKSKASEKLAMRLNLKKMKEDEKLDASDAEIHAIKAEKLRQHKMQEAKRHQSMLFAQKRSANTLQKRLEDLAAKRKAQQETSSGIKEGDSDESDED